MMFLQTVAEEDATGRIAEIYRAQRSQNGFVMEAARCFTTRPDMLPLYTDFIEKIRSGFSLPPRDWRLITLIAAKHVPSTYCSLVYAKQLIADLGSRDLVMAVQRDFRNVGLPLRDIEMLSYAEKVTTNASHVSEDDIGRLRSAGFSDQQIFDIALCASFRSFVSRFFDAVGASPDEAFVDEKEEFRAAMTVGRQIREESSRDDL
jgi:uncharacterized peroxidase-related enzyme